MFSRSVRREVILLLCLKAVVLTALYFLFFDARPAVTPASMQQFLSRAQ